MIPPPAPACLRQASMSTIEKKFISHYCLLLIVTAAHQASPHGRCEAQGVG